MLDPWKVWKKVGIALVVCGLILSVLGLIIGLLLPSSIRRKVTEMGCIDSKDHSQYNTWVGPSTSENFIYHWHIANKDDFLYNGAVPKFEEKGPYVYTEETKKIDVKFDEQGHRVSYKSFTKQKFDANRTAQLCKQCKEDDKLSVLNSAYLGFMAQSGGADNFGKAFVPSMVSQLLNGLSNDENTTFELLAKKESKMSALPNCEKFNPMFGSWVQKAGHLSVFNNASFTPDEMRGLYGILVSAIKFGPPWNPAVLKNCTNLVTGDPCQPACGFMLCIGSYAYTAMSKNYAYLPPMQKVLAGYLCPTNSSACFNFTESEHLLILSRFVLNVLPAYVHWSMNRYNYGLVTTRSQSDLALGYLVNLPMPGYPKGYFVKGGLSHHVSEEKASSKGAESTFYTCRSSDGTKYQWAKHEGSDVINQRFFPKATLGQRKIRGYLGQFPETAKLKECKEDYGPTKKRYEMFLSSMYVHVNITYKKAVQVEGLKMHRYELEQSALDVDDVFVFKKGLIDMSNVHSFPSYMSFPRFLEGDPELWKRLNLLEADIEKHGTFVDIEPVSGWAMNAKFRLQFNVGLNKKVIPSKESSFSEFKIKDVQGEDLIVFPVFWIEAGGKIGAKDAANFKSQVFGILHVGCGVLVSLPLIGGTSCIIGIALIVMAYKKGETRVADVNTD